MNEIYEMESSLLAAEKLLGISLTIIDSHGSLHDGSGRKLFPGMRQSHKKNAICAAGFCHKCVERCRHWALAQADSGSGAYLKRCWKGLVELVVPIRTQGGLCVGLLYGGIWREEGRSAPRNKRLLPVEATDRYLELEEFDPSRGKLLGEALRLLAAGLAAKLERLLVKADAGSMDRRTLIREYIFEHAGERVSLERLGTKLGVSSSRAGHAVRELFGCGMESLVMEERINRAKSLLSSTSLRISEVGVEAGFPDKFSFSRRFKRESGLSPKAYRAMHKEN